jgi:hypothetical protein
MLLGCNLKICGPDIRAPERLPMSVPVLYSTNTFLKFHIQQRFRNDIHWVWCSEIFDSSKAAPLSPNSLIAPSSSPADIYRELQRDVERRDGHSAKISAQRASLQTLAIEWQSRGEISSQDMEEIIFMVTTASFDLWRPLLYVIPTPASAGRLQLVPIEKRANFGKEYIIGDLARTEFDVVEF